MREINLDEKKKIMLSLMDEIDSFCRRNHIRYFLVGGSLLGAVRHQGFIPWDDDMDIGMPRADYERFLRSFVSQSDHVRVICHENTDHYIWPSAKAIDDRTVLLEQDNPRHAIGVFIDIFPFDYIEGTYEDAVKCVKSNEAFQLALTLKYLKVRRERPFAKNVCILLSKIFYLVPNQVLIRRINSNGTASPSVACRYVCNFCGAWGVREISEAENFEDTTELPFEGRRYLAPIGYDRYLTTVYGDYMTPPPKEKQTTHHDSIAYWKEKV